MAERAVQLFGGSRRGHLAAAQLVRINFAVSADDELAVRSRDAAKAAAEARAAALAAGT